MVCTVLAVPLRLRAPEAETAEALPVALPPSPPPLPPALDPPEAAEALIMMGATPSVVSGPVPLRLVVAGAPLAVALPVRASAEPSL